MNLECAELALTIDTREKNWKRIQSVKNWFEQHGGAVEHAKLDHCDYRIQGSFRNMEIDVGIEAKSMSDFAGSIMETTTLNLRHKLAEAYFVYKDVALFVESGDYSFTTLDDDFHAVIKNSKVRDGSADVLQLAHFENALASFQSCGIHVRQLRSEYHFPYAIAGLLIYLYNPIHVGIELQNDKNYENQYLNVVSKMPGIGYKTASKLMQVYPNLFWLASASESDIQDTVGKVKGSAIYTFMRNHLLETKAWKQSSFFEKIQNSNHIGEAISNSIPITPSPDDTRGCIPLVPCHSDETLFSNTTTAKTPVSSDDTAEVSILPSISSAVNSCHLSEVIYPETKTSIHATPNPSLDGARKDRRTSGLSCHSDNKNHPLFPLAPGVQLFGDQVQNIQSSSSEIPQSDSSIKNRQHISPPIHSAVSPPTYKMSLRGRIFGYLSEPRCLQEIVDEFSEFEKGYVWETVMKLKKENVIANRGDKYIVMVHEDREIDVGV